jgi:RHS repeat-associated protein
MAMKKRFYTMNSQMMAYDEGGVTKDFLTDHLGSITAEIDQTQARTYDTRYSAYGRNIWSTGTGCGFGWVGSYGYRETGLFKMSHYVRARHYSYITGGWSTVDPLWPEESAYGYAQARAVSTIDPSGLQSGAKRCKCGGPLPGDEQIIFFEGWPGVKVDPDCPPWFKDRIKRACDKLNDIPNNKRGQINACIAKASARAGLSGCMPVTLNRRQCLARFCQVDGRVHCKGLPPDAAGWSPGLQAECLGNFDRDDPSDDVWVVPGGTGRTYAEPFLSGLMTELVFVHELMHACGQHHNSSNTDQQCNDIQACCIVSVLYGKDSSKCVSGIKPPPKIKAVPKYTGRGIPNLLP